MFFSLKQELADAIAQAAGCSIQEALQSIELPKKQFGDLACTVAFSLAKKGHESPSEIAKNIKERIGPHPWIAKVETEGPYINFFLSEEFFFRLLEAVSKSCESFGRGKKKEGKIIVEFPSVNPNKPWHVGHLRNAILGDAVASLLEFCGYQVERIDYIDDLGLQVAQSFWGYKALGNKPEGKLDLWLGMQYVQVSRLFEQDSNVQAQVRQILKKMEEGIEPEASECRQLVEQCVAAQYETAFKFGIYHDALIFESDIVKTIFEEGMRMLKESKAVVFESEGKNAGCWVARLPLEEFSKMESPDKVLIRSDGTATYTGKDVIFQMWKFGLLSSDFKYEDFILQPNGKVCKKTCGSGRSESFGKATKVINVIGMEQTYPQKVIKGILELLGYKSQAENSIHLSYEHVWLEEEHFSGRQGTWIGYTADELYQEGIKKASAKIKEQNEDSKRSQIASAVAVAAIRFSFLRTTPEKKIVFKWEEALSLEGDSAPYALYAYARAHKIFSKAGKGAPAQLQLSENEKELLKKIMLLEPVLESAAAQLRPHAVAEYCLELATSYNKFYSTCPIISCEDEKIKANRLAINFAAMTVLKNALGSIGIQVLEEM
ncbi:MAG: arginine--tRNA ligase [Candidatus Anstonellaceae archaeon]